MNRFKAYTYRVNGLDVAASSQGTNFNVTKLKTAINQSLSLWTAYSPLRFEESSAMETDFEISFIKESAETRAIGTTIFGRSIEINVTNRLFIDKFNEPEYAGSTWGPWDFIRALTHEIGHVLGLGHPPKDENTGVELFPGSIMSSSYGEKMVARVCSPYDIDSIQQLHGALKLDPHISTDLQNNTEISTSFNGLHFIKGAWGVQVDGPVGNTISLYVFIPGSKGKKINSIVLNYNTYTANTLVHSVEVYDGIKPIQEWYVSSGISKYADIYYKQWQHTIAIRDKKEIKNGILLKINIEFRGITNTHDVGIFQLTSAYATSLHEFPKVSFPDITKIYVKK